MCGFEMAKFRGYRAAVMSAGVRGQLRFVPADAASTLLIQDTSSHEARLLNAEHPIPSKKDYLLSHTMLP
eukprot:382309-Amphidinium_carterae.1